MPVQINEMIIRANIAESNDKAEGKVKPVESSASKDEIIRECTEIILEILKTKNER